MLFRQRFPVFPEICLDLIQCIDLAYVLFVRDVIVLVFEDFQGFLLLLDFPQRYLKYCFLNRHLFILVDPARIPVIEPHFISHETQFALMVLQVLNEIVHPLVIRGD